jgi:hypothetical protein
MDECTQGALNKQSIDVQRQQTDVLFKLVSDQTKTLNEVASKVDVMATDVGWLKSELVQHIKASVENIKQIHKNRQEAMTAKASLTQCWAVLCLTFASVIGMAFMVIQDLFKK